MSDKLNISNSKKVLFAIRDTVLFPGMVVPISIKRTISVKALKALKIVDNSGNDAKQALFTVQSNQEADNPGVRDLYKIGVIGRITHKVKLDDNRYQLLVTVDEKVKLSSITKEKGYFVAEYSLIQEDKIHDPTEIENLLINIMTLYNKYIKLNKRLKPDLLVQITSNPNQTYMINALAAHITCNPSKKQALLELTSVKERLEVMRHILIEEVAIMETEELVQNETKKQVEKTQRDYYLNEQMKVIQKVLGVEGDKSDIVELQKKINTLKLSKEAKEKAEGELKKLKLMNPMAAEASVIRNYLDTLLGMPWGKVDKAQINIKKASSILDRDHYGLQNIKERIIEFIAVLQRTKQCQGSILCLVGPPGVGKTSLVKSIAEAIGRKYMKFSLGGVRDEAEVRGHRRTYIGAMPGKIISLIKQAKTDNPVLLLDELDKIASDFRGGDPASALLELLDPEQNKRFSDHYLEVPYDLSSIVFIATANGFPRDRVMGPLLDRMEIIRIAGYVEEEKLEIAKRHLIPKQMKINGIKSDEFIIEEDAILELIRRYTKEAGVRALERKIGSLIRKVLRQILNNKISFANITANNIEEYLGIPKYKFSEVEEQDKVGITTGLAYTEVGGDLLYIEAVTIPGKGEIKATGKLGDTMKESVYAAYSYFLSRTCLYKVNNEELRKNDIHIHVPEGAIPKDGPSAGIAIFTTIASLISGVAVKQSVAMTGEITLRGRVLPIGGLKEKLLAAKRGGIKTVIIPEENMRDLQEVPESIKEELEIIPVIEADQVLDVALTASIRN